MKRILTMKGRRQTADGFTLIEMLAALALAVILMYVLFLIFGTTSRAMATSNARTEIYANARAILRIMHQEISAAFLDTSQDADGDDDADYFIITSNAYWHSTVETIERDTAAGHPEGHLHDADVLQFLTSSAVGTNSALNEVGYWLDYSTDVQRPTLRRWRESASFDASDQVPLTDTTDASVFGQNVLGFNVAYYEGTAFAGLGADDGNDRYTEASHQFTHKAQEKKLPSAVRITLRVKDKRGRIPEGEEFVEIIAIQGRE